MKRIISISLMIVLMGSVAHAGWLDRYCEKNPTSRLCISDDPPVTPPDDPPVTPPDDPSGNGILKEVQAVPYLSDETATYVFNSTVAGSIIYGGACGNGDKTQAVVGNNTITWKLAEGAYNNCTVKVGNDTLEVPAFKSTSKYPIVFVHGWMGNSAAWNNAKAYLTGKGWDSALLIAKSITESNNTLCGDVSTSQAAEVAEWVDDALEQFPGFTKVDLVGHSRGGSNIMRGLWHGYIDANKVRNVVTLAGANRHCGSYFPPIPGDETPGSIKYSVYYSDGSPDYDTMVNYNITRITGAYLSNLHPLSHSEINKHTTAMEALIKSLTGAVGSN